jgi:hypothetical protein
MSAVSIDDLRAEAHRLEQQGFYEQALGAYSHVLTLRPGDAEAAFHFKALQRSLKPRGAYSDIKVIWQTPPEGMWEKEWVRHLPSGLAVDEVADGQRQAGRDCALIIDSHIGGGKLTYYAHLFHLGLRFGIVHLSDELYADDCRCYHYANFVIRNYWSCDHAQNRRVLAVPLGLNNGYAPRRRTTAERGHVWSFLGAINKSARIRMMEVMAQVPDGSRMPWKVSPHPSTRGRISTTARACLPSPSMPTRCRGRCLPRVPPDGAILTRSGCTKRSRPAAFRASSGIRVLIILQISWAPIRCQVSWTGRRLRH